MPAGQGSIEYIGKISLDASELMKVLGMGAGAGGGGGGMAAGTGGPATAGDLKQQENIRKGMGKAHKDPSFMSIFKPLVALEGVKALVANSRVANAYLGGMGKMFSAAIDLLLLPFTPIFNLLMVAMSKLIGWLIDSGVLEWVAEGVEKLVDLFGGFVNWVKLLFTDPGKAIMDAIKWLWSQIKAFFKDPIGSLGKIAQVGIAGAGVLGAAAMMPVIGGPIRAGLGAVAGGIGGMLGFGRGRGGGGGGAPVPVGGGGGRGLRMGGMGRMLGGGALMAGGLLGGQALGQQGGTMGTLGRIGGMGMMGAGAGLMFGGPMGAAVGGGIGLGVGALDQTLLGGKIGNFLGMGGKGGGGGGGGGGKIAENIKNVGTQNVTFNIYVKDKEMVKEIYDKLDEQMTASAEAG
jgi:hypothetical protein